MRPTAQLLQQRGVGYQIVRSFRHYTVGNTINKTGKIEAPAKCASAPLKGRHIRKAYR